jgi:hypothetical protein
MYCFMFIAGSDTAGSDFGAGLFDFKPFMDRGGRRRGVIDGCGDIVGSFSPFDVHPAGSNAASPVLVA